MGCGVESVVPLDKLWLQVLYRAWGWEKGGREGRKEGGREVGREGGREGGRVGRKEGG